MTEETKAPQSGAERRVFPRMSISGGGYRVTFRIDDHEVTEARLVNLSAGGCGLEVQVADARGLDNGVVLEALYLDHPDLPFVPLQGAVVRLLGKVPGKTTGYVLAGVEFTLITPFLQGLIQDHVARHLNEGG